MRREKLGDGKVGYEHELKEKKIEGKGEFVSKFNINQVHIKVNDFYKILTNINKLKLMCFLTDLGYLYTRVRNKYKVMIY